MASPKSSFLRSLPFLTAAFVVVAVCVPVAFMFSGRLAREMRAAGTRLTPNLDGGAVLAEFADPAGDLLRPVPTAYAGAGLGRALDLRSFAVKRVRFSPWAGMGLDPRLNLVFTFDGPLPADGAPDGGFNQPAIHVYLRAPGRVAWPSFSDRAVRADFAGGCWNYLVIVDGGHSRARIYDQRGQLVGRALGQYLENAEEEKPGSGGGKEEPSPTTLTVALPMDLVGDPAAGDWSFWVLTGLADPRSPAMLYPPAAEGGLQVFDTLRPDGAGGARWSAPGRPLLLPLALSARR